MTCKNQQIMLEKIGEKETKVKGKVDGFVV
jgi:hypothetical protein